MILNIRLIPFKKEQKTNGINRDISGFVRLVYISSKNEIFHIFKKIFLIFYQ